MLPVERQEYIKSMITERENIKISELSKLLNVSEMTIHRDIKPIIEEGLIVKSFGGISLVKRKVEEKEQRCIYCRKQIQERMAFQLMCLHDRMEIACCAHCGLLRFKQLGSDVKQVICYDFFRQTTINATMAWFVIGSSVDLGCCQPQVITFEREDHAKGFVKGFSGNVYTFSQAVEKIFNIMQGEIGCHTSEGR